MLRAILAVIIGCVIVGLWVMVTDIAASVALGADFVRTEATSEATIGWSVISIGLGAIGAVIGGLIVASIGRATAPVKVLAGIILVLGLGMAVMDQMGIGQAEDTRQAVPAEEVPWWEAGSRTKQPVWYTFAIPFAGCAGVLIGGRVRRGRVSTKATGEVGPV